VCVKQILDPDMAASVFTVDEATNQAVPFAARMVISPFDAQAIEVAMRLRDAGASIDITVLSLGAESARAIVKQCLALGADDGVLLTDNAYEGGDSCATAGALAAAIRKIGDVDLVLTGRQAADDDAGVVGLGIAELLRIPAITFAADVRLAGGKLVVERALADGAETVECTLPALVTVSHEVGAVRHASLRETMKAARKPMQTWSPADLGLDDAEVGARGARRVLERLYLPKSVVECEYVTGDTPEGQAAALVARLIEAKVI
jgi:electron transfer flavoprotein beta subunit